MHLQKRACLPTVARVGYKPLISASRITKYMLLGNLSPNTAGEYSGEYRFQDSPTFYYSGEIRIRGAIQHSQPCGWTIKE